MQSSTGATREASDGVAVGADVQSASPEVLRDLRRQFADQHYLKLPGFLGRGLLDWADSQLAAAEWETRHAPDEIGSEWRMKPNSLSARLDWLMNEPGLLRAFRDITGAQDIAWFVGRVFRMEPSQGQSFNWHDDRGGKDERLLAMSVNLTAQPYAGGVLNLRRKRAPETAVEIPNPGLGDAIVFRVADELEHCVTPVTGEIPRLTFTGWYRTGPGYYSRLRQFGDGAGRDSG